MALASHLASWLLSGASLRAQKQEEQGTPSASSVKPPRTPWQTPPPAFAELATPQTAAATAGWQELCDEDPSKEGALCAHAAPSCASSLAGRLRVLKVFHTHPSHDDKHGMTLARYGRFIGKICFGEACIVHVTCSSGQGLQACMLQHAESGGLSEGKQEEEAKEWVDDGSLPLEDGKLPFFLLDAHEELGTPGTLYLFGKVRHAQPTSLRCYRSKPGVIACPG